MAQTQSTPIPLGMSNPMDMNHMTLPVPGLDVVQKLLLSFGLDPTHLSSSNPSLPHTLILYIYPYITLTAGRTNKSIFTSQ